jgi:hypothetical protein
VGNCWRAERKKNLCSGCVGQSQQLDRRYSHEYLNSRYLGRSFVRSSQKHHQLYDIKIHSVQDSLCALYPEAMVAKLDSLRMLEKERNLLIALRDGIYTPPDGVIRFRSKEVKKRHHSTRNPLDLIRDIVCTVPINPEQFYYLTHSFLQNFALQKRREL